MGDQPLTAYAGAALLATSTRVACANGVEDDRPEPGLPRCQQDRGIAHSHAAVGLNFKEDRKMVRFAAVMLTIAVSLAGCVSSPLRVRASFEEGASRAVVSRVYALVYMNPEQGWLARPLVDALGAELRGRAKLAGAEFQTIVPLALADGPDMNAARAARADSLLDCRVTAMSVSLNMGTDFNVRCELVDAHGKRIWRASFAGHRTFEMDERLREAAQTIVDRMHGDGLI